MTTKDCWFAVAIPLLGAIGMGLVGSCLPERNMRGLLCGLLALGVAITGVGMVAG